MNEARRHIHLEHDGKLLLVDLQGKGPAIPQMGRKRRGGFSIRLPTPEEAEEMGLTWKENVRTDSDWVKKCMK